MVDDVIPTSSSSPAAVNRYIYYPDHLVRMPGFQPGVPLLTRITSTWKTLFQEPLFRGIIRGFFLEPYAEVRPESVRDESVGDFLSRRYGEEIADNFASALLHGIYAGDLYKLSAKTLFPLIWHLEEISEVGILGELAELMWNGETLLPYDDVLLNLQTDQILDYSGVPFKEITAKLEGSSVYTFKKGLAQLAETMEARLRVIKNVEIKTMNAAIAFDPKIKQFSITDAALSNQTQIQQEKPNHYDYVVATISPNQLSQSLKEQSKSASSDSQYSQMLRHLHTSTSTVDVMVVNLFYRNPNLVPVSGFGYLIPRSISIDQNPERALGVIFGSETSRASYGAPSESPSQSNPITATPLSQDSVPGTKLTVMLGGHWWSNWSASDLPTEASGIEMAKSILHRHLGITDEPLIAKARMQWKAIPQYEVGHHERMARIHTDLRREFHGRLKVAGSAYQGVGVNDCVKAAWKACFDIREGFDDRTGLEGFGAEARWAIYKRKEEAVYYLGAMRKRRRGKRKMEDD